MWPLLAKLASEAHDSPSTWQERGVRAVIMYPMNALVSDQLSRLRRIMGDQSGKFQAIFRKYCGENIRRPQFGMYTGRTPYPGNQPKTQEDRELMKTLAARMLPQEDSSAKNSSQKANSRPSPTSVRFLIVSAKACTYPTKMMQN